jgi:hypothetical protein
MAAAHAERIAVTPAELRAIPFSEKWFVIDDPALARALEAQLAHELRPGNPAHGRALRARLKSYSNDDVVFVEPAPDDGAATWWLIHLTWTRPVDSRWPDAVRIIFPDDLLAGGDADD